MLSMTGFGRGTVNSEGREITMEIKSVNHRFMDISLRAPRVLGFAEEDIKKCIGQHMARGHFEVSVQYKNTREDSKTITVDTSLAKQYISAMNSLKELGVSGEPELSLLVRMNDVLTVSFAEEDQEAILNIAIEGTHQACEQIISMRRREGEKIYQDLLSKLDLIEKLAGEIKAKSKTAAQEYCTKLRVRIKELMEDAAIDEQRLAQETAIMADRLAIDEELVRLSSHISGMREYMKQEGPLGRKLEFILQEINREVNTIGSKAMDAEIQNRVVTIKGELEKLREQVQNIE